MIFSCPAADQRIIGNVFHALFEALYFDFCFCSWLFCSSDLFPSSRPCLCTGLPTTTIFSCPADHVPDWQPRVVCACNVRVCALLQGDHKNKNKIETNKRQEERNSNNTELRSRCTCQEKIEKTFDRESLVYRQPRAIRYPPRIATTISNLSLAVIVVDYFSHSGAFFGCQQPGKTTI